MLDVHAPLADECRNALIPFAELERSPEHLHAYSRYDVPQNVGAWIKETAERFGKLKLVPAPSQENAQNAAPVSSADEQVDGAQDSVPAKKEPRVEYLYLVASDQKIYAQILNNPATKKFLTPASGAKDNLAFLLELTDRGIVKQKLLELGWPVQDEAPLNDGERLEITFRKKTMAQKDLEIRDYQVAAAKALVGDKGPGTGLSFRAALEKPSSECKSWKCSKLQP